MNHLHVIVTSTSTSITRGAATSCRGGVGLRMPMSMEEGTAGISLLSTVAVTSAVLPPPLPPVSPRPYMSGLVLVLVLASARVCVSVRVILIHTVAHGGHLEGRAGATSRVVLLARGHVVHVLLHGPLLRLELFSLARHHGHLLLQFFRLGGSGHRALTRSLTH